MKKVIKLLERLKTLKWEKERSRKKILTKKTVKKSRQESRDGFRARERERERERGGWEEIADTSRLSLLEGFSLGHKCVHVCSSDGGVGFRPSILHCTQLSFARSTKNLALKTQCDKEFLWSSRTFPPLYPPLVVNVFYLVNRRGFAANPLHLSRWHSRSRRRNAELNA